MGWRGIQAMILGWKGFGDVDRNLDLRRKLYSFSVG